MATARRTTSLEEDHEQHHILKSDIVAMEEGHSDRGEESWKHEPGMIPRSDKAMRKQEWNEKERILLVTTEAQPRDCVAHNELAETSTLLRSEMAGLETRFARQLQHQSETLHTEMHESHRGSRGGGDTWEPFQDDTTAAHPPTASLVDRVRELEQQVAYLQKFQTDSVFHLEHQIRVLEKWNQIMQEGFVLALLSLMVFGFVWTMLVGSRWTSRANSTTTHAIETRTSPDPETCNRRRKRPQRKPAPGATCYDSCGGEEGNDFNGTKTTEEPTNALDSVAAFVKEEESLLQSTERDALLPEATAAPLQVSAV